MAANTRGSSAVKESAARASSSRSSSAGRKTSGSTQRSTAGRTGSAAGSTRGKSSASTAKTRTSARSNEYDQEIDTGRAERQKEIYLFAFLAVSVFLLLSNFGVCGFIGNVISGFFFGLFGTITYLIPFYIFFSAAYLLSNGTRKKVVKKIIWIGVAILLVGFISQIIAGADGVTIKSLYMQGYKHKKGGGVIFGGMLSLLYKLIGKVGCIIFTVLFVLVAIIEIINVSFINLFKGVSSSFKSTANYGLDEDDYDEYDDYDDAGEVYRERNTEPKHILNNTTILDDGLGNTAQSAAPETAGSGGSLFGRSKKKKKKKVVYPSQEVSEISEDGSVKDIYSNVLDGSSVMPDFLKDSHEKIKSKQEAADAKADAEALSEDAFSAISGLSSYEKAPVEKDLDNGSRVDKEPGKTGIHRREHPIKTDIFDLRPERDSFSPYSSSGRERKTESIFTSEKTAAGTDRQSRSFEKAEDTYKKKSAYGAEPENKSGYSSDLEELTDNDYTAVSDAESDYSSLDSVRDSSYSSGSASRSQSSGRAGSGFSAAESTETRASVDTGTKASVDTAAKASGAVDIKPEASEEKTQKKKEYRFPPVSLLKYGKSSNGRNNDEIVRENGIKLKETLESFGVNVTITDYSVGPSVTRYELQPEQGVKVSKIVGLQDDIKLALAAADIRIEAPIPGKPAVGIEIPNAEKKKVYFRELIESDKFKETNSNVAFAVGKDIGGQVIVTDIAKMPHLLIAGATGSGKSVCVNTIIMSILYKAKPDDVKLIMIDPKMVELTAYNGIPHLLIPVVTDPKKAAGALNWAVVEMTKRYQLFANYNVRNIKGFNQKVETEGPKEDDPMFRRLPQIVVIVDELADLMMVAHAEVEDAIIRLCQLARAAGIHLIIATQRPSVDVITGLIKANVPSRIAFAVSSGVDSRTILDMNGAEKLLGKGDMLFYPTGYPKPIRVQGALIEDEEVVSIVEFIKKYNDGSYDENVSQSIENSTSQGSGASASTDGGAEDDRFDEYFEDAARLVIEKDKASIGNLQRVFRIGFNRAARIMDQLCDAGVVGPEEGTKPRKILMTMDQFDEFMSL